MEKIEEKGYNNQIRKRNGWIGMERLQEIRAVIFDQDGLMFDTERISAEAWNLAGQEMGVVLEEEFLCTIRGMCLTDSNRRLAEVFGSDFDWQELRKRKREHYQRLLAENPLPVKRGLKELLAFLQEKGYKIAVATASGLDYTLGNLERAGVREYFDQIVTWDLVEHAKPDPEIFLKVAELLGELPEHCMVLEDSINGVEAGVRGGFYTVMVPDLTQPDAELKRRVTAVCESLEDVKNMLLQFSYAEL